MFRNRVATIVMALSLLTALCSGVLFTGAASGSTMTTTPEPAAPGDVVAREEVIYASLNASGETQAIYAVTALEVSRPGVISDYGRFSSAKNLTTTAPLSSSDDQVSVNVPAGRFYYQGNLSSLSLPWDISIIYHLNGQKISPEALAGASGSLMMEISTLPGNQANLAYYENYLLQISVTLDTAKYTNIDAGGGTIANVGRNKLVTYTIMPGKVGHVTLGADVADMALSPIEIAALPFSMQLDLPDTNSLEEELLALTQGVSSLHQGTKGLQNGAAELRQGASALAVGFGQFGQGLGQLDATSIDLMAGSTQIKEALNAMSTAMAGSPGEFSLGSIAQLPQILSQLGLGLADISAGLTQLNQGFLVAYQTLDGAISNMPDEVIAQEQLAILYAANPEQRALLDSLVQYYSAGRTVKATYQAVQPAFAAMASSLAPIITSIDTIHESLSQMAQQMGAALAGDANAAMLSELTRGITTLAEQYEYFHAGLTGYTGGLSELAQAYAPLQGGMDGLSQGSTGLHQGVSQVHAGMDELNTGLKDLPERMADEINQLMSQYDTSDFEPVSFLSTRNQNTTLVQFVMRTERIEKAAKARQQEPAPAPLSFWDRLTNLFRQ